MTARLLRFGLALATLAISAGCSTGGSFPSDRVLTAADAGLVTLRVDEQFSVKLDANPSTGFTWHLLISNESLLIRQGEPVFAPDPNRATSLGVGGTQTFTYRTVAGGETQLRFEYKRASESDQPPKVVVFDLVVN